jgi:hypothetical protein
MVLIQSARAAGSPPAWLRPVLICSLLALGSIYWLAIRIIEKRSNSESPLEIRIEKDGMPILNEADRPLLLKAKLEGNSRIVVYTVSIRVEFSVSQIIKHLLGSRKAESGIKLRRGYTSSDRQARCTMIFHSANENSETRIGCVKVIHGTFLH